MRQEADGDSVAHAEVFAHFYARHYRLVLTVAQQRLSGVADAEDVAAETFRITWAHHQSGGDLSLPWVYKVLRNIIGNEYQRVARSTELFSRIGGLSGDSSYRMETADALDVRRALAGLRETAREILYMAYWEDLTRAEIASILGISTVTVRVRLLRARQTLKALLYNAVEDAHSEEVKDGRV